MMMPTHMSVSSLVAVPFIWTFPESSALVMFVALLCGILPDLDVFYGKHRKTMHFPVIYSISVIPIIILNFLISDLLISLCLLASVVLSIHCFLDILTGGSSNKPFPDIDSEACYNHTKDKWIEPLGIINHTGSISDYLIFVSTVAISYYLVIDILPSYFTYIFSVLLILSTLYVVVRRAHVIYAQEILYTFISKVKDRNS